MKPWTKLCKTINSLVNVIVAWRMETKIKKGKFRDFSEAAKDYWNKYDIQYTFKASDFTITERTNWGSARPDTEHVDIKDNVTIRGNSIFIKTSYDPLLGYMGKDYRGKDVFRQIASGAAYTKEPVPTKGVYAAIVTLDENALGSWDAWWFLQLIFRKRSKWRYKEVDMFERFFGFGESKKLTTSVHRGHSSDIRRQLYNHTYDIPHNRFIMSVHFGWGMTRVKINGHLVFVGLGWRLNKPSTMIVGTGIMKGWGDIVKPLLKDAPFWYSVENIQHLKRHDRKHKKIC